MKKIRELFLLLFCKMKKAEECCKKNSDDISDINDSIESIYDTLEECCSHLPMDIQIVPNEECDKEGFTILDVSVSPPAELYSGCFTSIEVVEGEECGELGGFTIRENGNQIFNYCIPEQEILYENTLFVDNIYGNNSTGAREQFKKPYKTIQSAINSALPGDTVHVRSGNYSEHIILKDKVNLYFEEVILTGTIKDNGVKVESSIRGGLVIKSTVKGTIVITAPGSNIIMDIIGGSSRDTFINIEGGTAEAPNKLSFTAKYLKDLQIDYFLRADGVCFVDIEAEEFIGNQSLPTWIYAMFHTRGNFEGVVNITGGRAYISVTNESELDDNILFWLNSTVGGEVYVNIDKIESYSSVENISSALQSTIAHKGKEKLFFKTENMYCEGTRGMEFHGEGSMVFEGFIECNTREVVSYYSENKLHISNSTLIRNYSDEHSDSVVIVSPRTESKLKIDNTSIITTQPPGIGPGSGVIKINTTGSLGPGDISCYLTNVDIIIDNPISATMNAIDSSAPRSVFMRDVVSNVDKSVNITDIAATTGFTLDANLPKIY